MGMHVRGNTLLVDPCIPRSWPGFEITYKHGTSRYRIAVENPSGVCRGVVSASLDGVELPGAPWKIALIDDGSYHYAVVKLG